MVGKVGHFYPFFLLQKLLKKVKVIHFLDSDVGWHGLQELLTEYSIFNFVKIVPRKLYFLVSVGWQGLTFFAFFKNYTRSTTFWTLILVGMVSRNCWQSIWFQCYRNGKKKLNTFWFLLVGRVWHFSKSTQGQPLFGLWCWLAWCAGTADRVFDFNVIEMVKKNWILFGFCWLAGSDIFQNLLKVNHFLDSDVGWHGVQELLTEH